MEYNVAPPPLRGAPSLIGLFFQFKGHFQDSIPVLFEIHCV